MADRRFIQFLHSFRKKLTFLEYNFVVGGSGAVGTVKGAGVASITHSGTGLYRITFEDAYNRFLSGGSGFVDGASVGSPVIMATTIKGNPNTTIQSKYIDVAMYNTAGALTDPPANLVWGGWAMVDNTSVLPANEM